MQYGIKAKDGMMKAGIGTPKPPKLKSRFCIELFNAETGTTIAAIEGSPYELT